MRQNFRGFVCCSCGRKFIRGGQIDRIQNRKSARIKGSKIDSKENDHVLQRLVHRSLHWAKMDGNRIRVAWAKKINYIIYLMRQIAARQIRCSRRMVDLRGFGADSFPTSHAQVRISEEGPWLGSMSPLQRHHAIILSNGDAPTSAGAGTVPGTKVADSVPFGSSEKFPGFRNSILTKITSRQLYLRISTLRAVAFSTLREFFRASITWRRGRRRAEP